MQKDFDVWNKRKKIIDGEKRNPDFHEREIWWCAIGVNVGSEQHSQTSDYSRPVVIVKKFTRDVFWAIPLTTKIKDGIPFRIRFTLEDMINDILVLQMRIFDSKRLIRKVGVMPKEDFVALINYIKEFL
ncbi:MAG: hypothetical protein A3C08_02520 [Candidatus Taylorbacteria bacterium RIFCSPHIGHO2_02_FULL_47_18]|uniref:mRNA interferase n=1 Tax=Candidatus Taylorbacteria bacterium RIFCSPLOWO2_01_FULL_48_100 TaxID=1802322 RepID=A0A1G2ND16_9BACT|nr:MAG: hypothetical protein A2670_03160 [Candidatus Taylorbacteria bacterium RIFCSPHIGHO2_01_FULL_48_38]OHA27575.1 MAG: hypothetical protein A3C08_02520 [Candidatus Taylorbacteria bacterium RIFCSPHIGHO2_02_FULL_47_18]OHA33997.1 MAG: hypothetical protein A2938_02400 [Candidatus Taylorbacteria bacterium RIFCSPLOWO2_01_FULL_48_100]OHA40422.1 MAG: hypothetical protein A3J31_02540 [Candidatus Taylorbacteria bacterium RIFCSPLOWO2_02_FULL_48_16]OHA44938.1 MAG: hypothetical protein A3H13_03485 [Candid